MVARTWMEKSWFVDPRSGDAAFYEQWLLGLAGGDSEGTDGFPARLQGEVAALQAALDGDGGRFEPGCFADGAAELLLPGLVAQLLAVRSGSAASERIELGVGRQLARMVGFGRPGRSSFGCLTAGGAAANGQALQVLRAVKFYPAALRAGMRRAEVEPAADRRLSALLDAEPVAVTNLSVVDVLALQEAWQALLNAEEDPARRRRLVAAVERERLESLGAHAFFSAHRECQAPVVLLPDTAEPSWEAAMRLAGMGEQGIVRLPTRGFRLHAAALERALEAASALGQSVLCVVGALGANEFGAFDPIHVLVEARERWHAQGLGFAVHADAGWGGYLAALLRDAHAGETPRTEVAALFRRFPTHATHAALAALAQADSLTVDPWRLGHLGEGAGGAYLCRDGRCLDFHSPALPGESGEARDARRLRGFATEGRRPAAAAAAAWLTHRVLPLDAAHFGRLAAHGIDCAEHFCDRLLALARRLEDRVRVVIPLDPDGNRVCLMFNPVGNGSAAIANVFCNAVLTHLRSAEYGGPAPEFACSAASIPRGILGAEDSTRLLAELGLAADTFTANPLVAGRDASELQMLRHTLAHSDLRGEVDHVERYCRFLERVLGEEAAQLTA